MLKSIKPRINIIKNQSEIIILGAFFIYLIWDQSYYWRTVEEYDFGYMMPGLVIYVIAGRWELIKNSLKQESQWGSVGIMIGLLFFTTGGIMRVGYGPMGTTSLIIALGFSSFLLGWAGLLGGKKLIKLLLFPSLIIFLSIPLLHPVESGMKLFLLRQVTNIVYFFYEILGYFIEKEGNILILPAGKIGVEEACSGIRSLTASLFIGSFLSATMLNNVYRKSLLIITSVFLAFFINILRSGFLTYYGYHYGVSALTETFHDIAGYSALLLLCLSLLSARWLLNLDID